MENGNTKEDDDSCFSNSGSNESKDTDAIRARARQIIMDMRGGGGGGGWGLGLNDSDGVNSPNLTWGNEKTTYSRKSIKESHIKERLETS